MASTIFIAVIVFIVAFVVLVAMQPKEFVVARSKKIAASPDTVYSLINDFHSWEGWSPWAKKDPQMKTKYSGSDAGEGAVYEWWGNKDVGEGRMTILESRPTELVRIKLEFLKPFKATNEAKFTFEPQGDETNVTWAMTGDRNFFMKAMGLFLNMDKMVGPDFEKGLDQLRVLAHAKS
ncbi:MAG: SRPBCC family protein [Deltaproteobacteria bacterium]|nr:SRPBCC family protein [Deltaproteobacteria bacterium]